MCGGPIRLMGAEFGIIKKSNDYRVFGTQMSEVGVTQQVSHRRRPIISYGRYPMAGIL